MDVDHNLNDVILQDKGRVSICSMSSANLLSQLQTLFPIKGRKQTNKQIPNLLRDILSCMSFELEAGVSVFEIIDVLSCHTVAFVRIRKDFLLDRLPLDKTQDKCCFCNISQVLLLVFWLP